MRLTSTIWVSAYIRRCQVEGAYAVVRRRGSPEAGAIFVKLDRLDGTAALFGPAPQSMFEAEDSGDRRFEQIGIGEDPATLEARLKREIAFDSDLWAVEVEDRQGRHFLDLVRLQPAR
jgi:hypothetical protein